jgi:hypothetical protein
MENNQAQEAATTAAAAIAAQEECVSKTHLKLHLRLAELEATERSHKTPQWHKKQEVSVLTNRVLFMETGKPNGCCRYGKSSYLKHSQLSWTMPYDDYYDSRYIEVCACCYPEGTDYDIMRIKVKESRDIDYQKSYVAERELHKLKDKCLRRHGIRLRSGRFVASTQEECVKQMKTAIHATQVAAVAFQDECYSKLHLKLCLRLAELKATEKSNNTPQEHKIEEVRVLSKRLLFKESGVTIAA